AHRARLGRTLSRVTRGQDVLDSSRGWVTVAAGFVAMVAVFGVAYSFGAFFAPMAAEFGTGSGATSLVFSITACCWFLLGSVSGRAVDRRMPPMRCRTPGCACSSAQRQSGIRKD